jgi:hypothetical protein
MISQDFPLIRHYLAWKGVLGHHIRSGVDVIAGIGELSFILNALLDKLCDLGICTLNHIVDLH